MRTAAIGSPVVGLIDSSRSPWVGIHSPSKAPWFSASMPRESRILETLLKVSTVIGFLLEGSRWIGSPDKTAGQDRITHRLQCRTMYGLLPPLLLALFGAWCGTFAWGPSWPASAAAALALLGSLLWIAPPWRDPLRLGATGRLLPWALWIALAASGWASPVPRAGWVALIL